MKEVFIRIETEEEGGRGWYFRGAGARVQLPEGVICFLARGGDTYQHYFLKGVLLSRVFNAALRLLAIGHGSYRSGASKFKTHAILREGQGSLHTVHGRLRWPLHSPVFSGVLAAT